MKIIREAQKYLVVGAIGYLIDVSLFNALSLLSSEREITYGPIWFKSCSAVIAITFTYVANSRWTFALRTGRKPGFERILLYGLINIIGIGITILPLYISRYVLNLDSLIADNISANLVGVSLALVFRFLMNRKVVFPDAK